jgi:catechol 2,3-dioxygenase-like lactoylglutathione lyase family enzyme
MRIARPTADIQASAHFWVVGLGMDVLYQAGVEAQGGHALVMVGWPDAGWHIELVADSVAANATTPSEEELLVLYMGAAADSQVLARLVSAGGVVVKSSNPYWDQRGVTLLDPDGRRLVWCEKVWP